MNISIFVFIMFVSIAIIYYLLGISEEEPIYFIVGSLWYIIAILLNQKTEVHTTRNDRVRLKCLNS